MHFSFLQDALIYRLPPRRTVLECREFFGKGGLEK